MKEQAVVLLSAGLDSTTNFFAAVEKFDVVLALTFDYGQRAAKKEMEKARQQAHFLKVPHQVIHLDWLKDGNPSSLVDRDQQVPVGKQVDIDDFETSLETKKSVWVPNRNGVLLSVAASVAEMRGAKYIIPGFNKEEASTFPDNSQDYLNVLNHSLTFSTANHVEAFCFTIHMDKIEIVKLARSMNVPFDLIWPCYFDGEALCGECESCQRYQRAVRA
ncbi:MAG: 7-cyano-7-deazaguanine synthase QueC [Bdellovibrionales bacterium]|nr:7-cyano-7-deazaguanine synthase QueC [Bdellovibrionales bacterium]